MDNKERFRAMNVPHESVSALEADLKGFWDDIAAARVAHKLANVYVIVRSPVLLGDGTESEMGGQLRLGDGSKMLELAAWAFGTEQGEARNLIAGIVADAKKDASDR